MVKSKAEPRLGSSRNSFEGADMGEQQNRSLVEQGYQCFKTGDMEGLLSLFSADIE